MSYTNLYFDESGFTGNNLLDDQQTVFTYASVVTNDKEAEEISKHIINKYRIQNDEIKGGKLVKRASGKYALDEILEIFDGRYRVAAFNKKMALAGKFFEYIFEPALQRNNILFYNINFHRFISNMLYVEFIAKGAKAEELFDDFEKLIRTGDFEAVQYLFSAGEHPDVSPMLKIILEFALNNKEHVIKELDGYVGEGSGKWILDLTTTALFSLLASWGEDFDQLTAFCDDSKPLQTEKELFTVMINRVEKHYSNLAGKKIPISFNLSGPINLVNSRDVHGIQIADAIAAVFAYACDPKFEDDFALKWREKIDDSLIYGSIFPDVDYLDLNQIEVQRNALVLMELAQRSSAKIDLLEGMPQYVDWLTFNLKFNPLPLNLP